MKKFGIVLGIVALLGMAYVARAAPDAPWNVQSTSSIVGSTVETRQGEKIGDITDLVVDPETGHVAYVAVSTADGGKVLAVPWTALQRSVQVRTFVLDKDKATIAKPPSFAKNALPTGDRRQGEAIYTFYGQQPYWETLHRIPVTVQSVGPDKTTATVKMKQGTFPEETRRDHPADLHLIR
jgi:sporulation protein YlmC with PRC-barrel domain